MAQSRFSNSLQSQRLIAAFFGLLSVIYIYILLLSPPQQLLPGEPLWAVQPETLKEIVNESINFFFILPFLNAVGIESMQAPIIHPWIESLFNFAEAWIFMFLPLLLLDSKGRELPKIIIWSLAMFLTNTFLLPYMAWWFTVPNGETEDKPTKGLLAKIFGFIGLIVGTISLVWAVVGRPEFGDIAARSEFFVQNFMSNRVTIAFCVDVVLFYIFQIILMGSIEPVESQKRWLRFIPFWGLAVWLIL
ncbi:MAG: hypothetical protein WAN66_08465 [Limnoraphis robusta]|uniref:Uncharacterized protein n=1 Tax=Limnoraphis robusta CS-951 TaxID=1637645 RepID=A0A0F5YFT0_9CYAN|nr:hypothetical protein [Limnoraphis robusta]KKD37060.1 hypothetical protein WN50_16395 [Limnoraphis robusta CS-951]MEA5496764.1 hypothetical protein [Limnoraphis robusta BA-68 BA1]